MNKLTKEQVKFFIETMTDDMHNTTQHEIAETLLSKFDDCESLESKLLAYEQAAEKPYGYLEPCDFPRTTATVYPEKDKYAFMPLYAAPVLPKQHEPVVLYMGRELISKEGLELIRDGISEATQLESMCMASAILGGNYHAQPVIPEGLIKAINRLLDNDGSRGCFDALEQHRAKTEIERLLASTAQPVSEPYKLKDAVEDIRNSGVEIDADKIKAERDALNSPVIPDGWKLVPEEATMDMLKAGAKQYMKWEAFQHVWLAMLAAAPAQESE